MQTHLRRSVEKTLQMTSKPGSYTCSGNSMGETYLLTMRCPAYRRHDSYLGSRRELENRVGDDKGKRTSGRTTRPKVPMHWPGTDCFVVVRKRGNSRGAKGAGHPHWDGVNGQPEELLVLMEGGSLLQGGTSRMRRESHVRICEGLGVKAPGPTRRIGQLISLPRYLVVPTTGAGPA